MGQVLRSWDCVNCDYNSCDFLINTYSKSVSHERNVLLSLWRKHCHGFCSMGITETVRVNKGREKSHPLR